MAQHVVKSFEQVRPAQLVYVSSDAVYDESDALVRETTRPAPTSMHGAMHFARERLLALAAGTPICILRPSLLYGADDPHNGYGPNRFARMASRGETISLFGEGEEQRDHVFIADVARLIVACLKHRSTGILNIATGQSPSFRDVAEKAVALHGKGRVEGTPRRNPLTHRHFDPTACLKAFPDFSFTQFDDGFRAAYGT
jgi:nucleoside-diphosphate-sugar epimerase